MGHRHSRNRAGETEKKRPRPKGQALRIADSEGLEGTKPATFANTKSRPFESDERDQIKETPDASTTILPSQTRHVDTPAYIPPIPMEIVEIIIDNVDGGATFLACSLVCREWLARCRYYLFSRISTPAASCFRILEILDPARLIANSNSASKGPATAVNTLPPAGIFVQSLVITPSADCITSFNPSVDPRHNPALAVKLLIESTPNVKELQLTGVSEWVLSHFLNPISKMKKLEDLALVDVRCSTWGAIATSLADCAPALKSLRISALRFGPPPKVGNAAIASTSTNFPKQQLYFPLLKILSVEMELQGSPFIEELLDNLAKGPSGSLENLEVLELPIERVSRSPACLKRVKGSLQSLTVHCDKITTTHPIGTEPKPYTLGLAAFSRLRTLHFSIHAERSYGRPALVILRTLVDSLSSFPYSTLTCLRLTFRALVGYPPFTDELWKQLDDALSLPHLAELERVELVGMGSFIAGIKKSLPKSCARGILHFLW